MDVPNTGQADMLMTNLQAGGYKLPFVTIGGATLLGIIPSTLLARKLSGQAENEESKQVLSWRVALGFVTDLRFMVAGI
jgi:hypothetical protein